MSRNKFELILRFRHFENNDSADKTDRLYKIRKLSNIANDIFKDVHQHREIIAVDESMITYRGSSNFDNIFRTKLINMALNFLKCVKVMGIHTKL